MDRKDEFGSPTGDGANAAGSDGAWEAITQADPAVAAGPDLTRLRGKVDMMINADNDAPIERPQDTELAPNLARVEPIRRTKRPWIAVAAVAAVIAVSGGGGYAIGALSDDDATSIASENNSPSQVPYLGNTTTSRERAAAGSPESAFATADSAADTASAAGGGAGAQAEHGDGSASSQRDRTANAWDNGRFNFIDGGLSQATTSAEAWGFDSASVSTKEHIAEIAEHLGVEGTPKQDEWGWTVTQGTDSDKSVTLSNDGSVYFYNSNVYADQASADAATSLERGTDSDNGRKPATDKHMTKVINDTFAALGVDASAANIEIDPDNDSGGYRWASVKLPVGGTYTEAAWWFSFYGKDLTDLSGDLSTPVSLGDYAVVSPAEALTRLGDIKFQGSTYPTNYPAWMEARWSDPSYYEQYYKAVPPPAAGSKFAFPVADVTITTATLGLSTYSDADGARVMLPTYALSDADGATWQVLAIASSAIDTTLTK